MLISVGTLFFTFKLLLLILLFLLLSFLKKLLIFPISRQICDFLPNCFPRYYILKHASAVCAKNKQVFTNT